MRLLFVILAVLLFSVAYRLWISEDGLRDVWRLQADVEAQQDENAGLATRNANLQAEVEDLELGTAAVEERARNELGMVRDDETFYQVIADPADAAQEADAAE